MKLDLLLHNRLGDAIMGFPAVLCLRQLMAAGLGPIQQVRLIAPPALCELVRAASLFPDVAPLGWRSAQLASAGGSRVFFRANQPDPGLSCQSHPRANEPEEVVQPL
jgi:hypothetical protein